MAARIVAHIMARTPNLAMCAASCSPSSVRWVQVQPLQPLQPLLPLRPLRPLHPLQLQPRHRRGRSALGRASSASIQSRLSEVAVVVGPCTPNFRRLRRGRSRPRRPLFLIWHRFLPTYWDFESGDTVHLCPIRILTGLFISHLCPILTGQNLCVLFSQG